ncbi:hypothetical protein TPHA_0B01910 [Tetrapisispora phaffii CBS 4417]|uniref:Pru domain-containing protein n=1 Tax=Tetrapisispora phaffii (strain ATCC 24235 / CBS 4417 / NBRC 1672 / NRRL Y-8282 / UCD 70-5) TaxID=1071381 RepID=G8BPD2_TETPH|nr:hypothetical protein TPHA_0B01910 [Tetrapisispora phaffii CBS 4417]CCE61863.1 hypothetical protein TPHA_0B01910 [Tetrapisispora phaffii CBS 4417]
MSTVKSIPKKIKFRAGIAKFDEVTKECIPLAVQGEIHLDASEEESELGFYDFEWKPTEDVNNPNNTPINLILIPGETVFVPIKSCTTGRVFAIIFSSNEKYFFWLQEKNPSNLRVNELSSNDKEIYQRITAILTAFEDDEDNEEGKALLNEKEKDVEME